MKITRRERINRKHKRVRKKIYGVPEKPRLSIYRSLKHIHAQIIDDTKGITLVSASTVEKEVKNMIKGKTKTEAAKILGKTISEKALSKGISRVVFDRGGFIYHGRVKAFADGAREGGLQF